ncbi:MAG: hypothetical protein VYE77_01455 [Planctomycetota bacterium]|nr:hypothetical protein [Planctomycetota bacterium]
MPGRSQITPRLLHRLCYDVLLRGPKPAEMRSYVGADTEEIVQRLLQSREAMSAWFEEQLQFFLLLDRFRPRGDSIEQLPRRLQRGQLDARSAIGEILLSTGFSLRNPGNDTFVTVVLEQCLGLVVQDRAGKKTLEAGKKMYDGKKARFLGKEGRNQSDLIQAVLHDEQFTRHLLDRYHRHLLNTPLPKDADIAEVHGDFTRFFPKLGEWMASPEYQEALDQRRTKTERQFLRGLYVDLLERVPDEQEMRNLRNAMQAMADPAPLRTVLAKVILDSSKRRLPPYRKGEDQEFVRECFQRYLARSPNQPELAAFTEVLASDGGEPIHVVRALVGSLEYQTY